LKYGQEKGSIPPNWRIGNGFMKKEISRLLFEAGLLKTVRRSGWDIARAPRESVAEHVYRTCIVGMVLAKMAKLNEKEELLLLKACALHDLHEARVGDLHKLAQKYVKVNSKEVEESMLEGAGEPIKKSFEGALYGLPQKIKNYLEDADKIECAITAKEYVDLGYRTNTWIENVKKRVKTKEGKELLVNILKFDSQSLLYDIRKK